jgi:hypothetical protein
MKGALSSSTALVLTRATRRNIPEDAIVHSHCRENLKSYIYLICFIRQKKCVLEEGIEKAKRMLTCVFKQVQAALDMHQVISAGPFLYLILQEVCSSIVEGMCVSNKLRGP